MSATEDTGRQSFRDLVISGLEQVNEELKEMRARLDQESQARARSELQAAVQVAKIETKIAIYSGLGAILGSAVVTWLIERMKG